MLNPKTAILSHGQIRESGIIYPWYNKDFLEIWKNTIQPDWEIFEYGMGWGTHWHAIHVKSVTSVEHNHFWYSDVKKFLEKNDFKNVKSYNFPLTEKYTSSVLIEKKMYDCIIIDGRMRVKCLDHALKAIKKGGIIVLDNSERERYKPIFDKLGEPDIKTFNIWGTVYWRIL